MLALGTLSTERVWGQEQLSGPLDAALGPGNRVRPLTWAGQEPTPGPLSNTLPGGACLSGPSPQLCCPPACPTARGRTEVGSVQPGGWGPHGAQQRLTAAAPAVLAQQVAILAGALKGAGQVRAAVLTAATAGGALVHVCGHTQGGWRLSSGGRGLGGPSCPGPARCARACWVIPRPQPSSCTQGQRDRVHCLREARLGAARGAGPAREKDSELRRGTEWAGPRSPADSRGPTSTHSPANTAAYRSPSQPQPSAPSW